MPPPGDHRTPNPEVPPKVAAAIVDVMRDRGFSLDYSVASLEGELDQILDLPIFSGERAITVRPAELDVEFDMESAASAYLGETLARQFDGAWTGYFDSNSGVNFYTSVVSFGEYRLFPVRWLSYRVAHGRQEGSVADWLARVLPSIRARVA